jgi:Na+/melibiose symporter-like transporter
MSSAPQPLPLRSIVALGQFAFPLAVAYLPLNLYLTRYYAGDLRIDIATVGLVLMLARLGDFIVDPVVGALADRFGHAYGRRRLWTAISVPVTMLGVYLTFLPPPGAGPAYLLMSVMTVYFGWTLATIAYGAWGAEASGDYSERTRITGVREMFALLGILVASLAPQFSGGGPGSTEGFGSLMEMLGWTVIVMLPLSATLLVAFVPEPVSVGHGMVSWWQGVRVAASNGPFMRLLASNFFGRVGSAANLAVVIWFFEKGLDLGEGAGLPIIVWLVTAVLGAPLWIWAGHLTTKHHAIVLSSCCGALVFSVLAFLPPHQFFLTLVIMALAGISGSASATLGASIAADVIDLDALRSREQRAGLLLAFWGMAQKGADAIGVGAGLFILSLFSFDPNGPVTAEGLLGLKIVYIVLPILFAMLSAAFVWNFPLTPKRQKRIRALLHRRAMRLASKPTSSGHRN